MIIYCIIIIDSIIFYLILMHFIETQYDLHVEYQKILIHILQYHLPLNFKYKYD